MPSKVEAKDLITSHEMHALELNAEYFGVPRLLLMENAGSCLASEIASRTDPSKPVAIFCGLGGNGGDGFVAARHLAAKGFKVTVILAGKAKEITDISALENWNALQPLRQSISIHEVYDSSLLPETSCQVVVDALLGTGSKGRLRPPILQMVRRINDLKAFRVAVDVPTGIDSDTGETQGEAVKANLTVTFYKIKKGLTNARRYTGEIVVGDMGLPRELEEFAGPGNVLLLNKSRRPDSHKGDFGRLLVIGGSETYSGAPTLVAMGAMRAGVDLVYVAAPEKTAEAISSMSPDLITIKLKGEHLSPRNVSELKAYVEKVDAVVLGPGLNLDEETFQAVKTLVKLIEDHQKALLLDADGLKAFAQFKRKLKTPLVLTPHAGEYQILTGKKLPDSLDDKVASVQETAKELMANIVLKGAVDIISDGKRFKLNFTGNPGMTVGGTGDVLSGIIGAFLAQKAEAFEAAVAGAFVNGAAGDFVYAEKGYHMVATDLISQIPKVLNNPMSHMLVRKAIVGTP